MPFLRWLRAASFVRKVWVEDRRRQSAREARANPPAALTPAFPWANPLRAGPVTDPARQQELPRVSAVILNRDGACELAALFASLDLHNRYPDLELILVDHGSQDDSLEVARHWAKKLPIRIIRCRDNHSFSTSCNRAAEIATGEVLCLLNNDIVFVSDALGHMVGALRQHGGMVGIRQYEHLAGALGEYLGPEHHIGIRLRWNRKLRFLAPFNSGTMPGDGLVAFHPASFPAVTASIQMCWRKDYLALGGLSEAYFYGYEDVDLSFKFRFQHTAPVVSCNDSYVLHGDGRTRKRSSGKASRARHRHNVDVMARRFGYALRRDYPMTVFAGTGAETGRATVVLMVVDAIEPDNPGHDYYAVRELAAALCNQFGWDVRFTTPSALKSTFGVDLVILATPKARLASIQHWGHVTLTAAWVLAARPEWQRHPDFPVFDLRVCASPEDARALESATGVPVGCLPRGVNLDRFCEGHPQAIRRAPLGTLKGIAYRDLPPHLAGASDVDLTGTHPEECCGLSGLALAAAAAGASPKLSVREGDAWAAAGLPFPGNVTPDALRQAMIDGGYGIGRRADALRAAILNIVRDCHRIVCLHDGGRGEASAMALAGALRSRGHGVRLQSVRRKSAAMALRDDVVILFAHPLDPVPGDRIVLRCQPFLGHDPVHGEDAAVTVGTDWDSSAVEQLLDCIAEGHAARRAGPCDAPLVSRAADLENGETDAFWEVASGGSA